MAEVNESGDFVKKNEVRVWESILPRCEIIFDVGCRNDTQIMRLSPPKSSVFMFDINDRYINEIIESKTIPEDKVVGLFSYGLGNSTRRVPYFPNTDSAFYRERLSDENNSRYLIVKSVGDHLKEYPVERIDFCKIDVEGYEPEVIEGISTSGVPVGILQFELTTCWYEKDGREKSLSFLQGLLSNYKSYVIFDKRNPYFKGIRTLLHQVTDLNDIVKSLDAECGFDIIIPIHKGYESLLDEMTRINVSAEEIDFVNDLKIGN